MKTNLYLHLIFSCFFLLSSCGNNNQEAIQYLAETESIYKNGDYTKALERVDSIQALFPKSYEEIKSALALKQDIRRSINEEQIKICDSLLSIYEPKIDSIKGMFEYQKDPEDSKGIFVPKTMTAKTINSTMLRASVNEDGTMYLESLYMGGQKHNQVGVISKDKQSAESLPINDDGLNFKFSNLGQQYEVIRVTPSYNNGLVEFIYANSSQPLTVQLKGKNTISYALSNLQKKGITDSYLLTSWIAQRDSLIMEKGKATTLIEYLDAKRDGKTDFWEEQAAVSDQN